MIEELQRRWHEATGSEMPHEIAHLPIDRITLAVELTEAGQTVFVPRDYVPAVPVSIHDDSIRDWDKDSEF